LRGNLGRSQLVYIRLGYRILGHHPAFRSMNGMSSTICCVLVRSIAHVSKQTGSEQQKFYSII